MNIRTPYTATIKRTCTNEANSDRQVIYWRNNLFAANVIFLLPLCLIAMVPGIGEYI